MKDTTKNIEKDEKNLNAKSHITIKGINNELLIFFDDKILWTELINDLCTILDKEKSLWVGAVTSIDIGNLQPDEIQLKRLSEMLNKRYQLNVKAIYSKHKETRDLIEKNEIKTGQGYNISERTENNQTEEEPINSIPLPIDFINIPNTLYLKQTLRSGQIIRHDGNIVIIGDTNPGSEIIASGDIVVVGSLRGLAHAGATGNEKSQIISLNLKPTQLRIAGYIGRGEEESQLHTSEYNSASAWVQDGKIYVSSLKNKK